MGQKRSPNPIQRNTSIMKRQTAVWTIIAALCLWGPPVRAGNEIELSQVPAAVMKAVEKAVAGLKVTRVELEKEGGKTVYDVRGTQDGKAVEVEVTAGGEVLEIERGQDAEED